MLAALKHSPFLLAALLLAAPAAAGEYPACAGQVEIAGAKVLRVENDAVLVLEDGRAVDLEGILLPDGATDHAANLYTRQALATIREMTDGKETAIVVERPKEDRYGRIRAQVFFPKGGADNWIQLALLRQGLARVNMAPDRQQCSDELLAAERQARDARRGIWASEAYAVKTPASVNGLTGTFQIVEGTIKSVNVKNGRAYLNFGDDWRHDFTATIAPDDLAAFRKDGDDPHRFAGAKVRIRGWVETMNGPEIQIAAPKDIEVVGGVK